MGREQRALLVRGPLQLPVHGLLDQRGKLFVFMEAVDGNAQLVQLRIAQPVAHQENRARV